MIKIRENLYQGDVQDAISASKNKAVDAIVYVGQELPRELSHDSKIPVIHIPLKDGYNNELLIHLVFMNIRYLTLRDKTLVSCRAGISRSPTLVVGYLVVYHGHTYKLEGEEAYTLHEAFSLMHKLLPSYLPAPDFLKLVKDVAKSYWETK